MANPSAVDPGVSGAVSTEGTRTKAARLRTNDSRVAAEARPSVPPAAGPRAPAPAAGAHAAGHLINEDATPGAGVLPSSAHASGREVDGAAG